VITDAPLPPHVSVKAYNHPLGETTVSFFATRELANRYRRRFPASLSGAPILLPTPNTQMRRSVDQWLQSRNVHPRLVAEFEDSALLKAVGQYGHGIFPAPSVLEDELRRQYGVRAIGVADGVVERYYGISLERRIKHPAVAAITEAARERIFKRG
jgi:LysR family transcriptional activator of nhaA